MNLEELTQHQLSDEQGGAGDYRCFPVSWSISEGKDDSKSVAIVFRFSVHARWFPKEKAWSDNWAPGIFVDLYAYIGKADGTENASSIKMLADAGLWDGDLDKLLGPPNNIFVLVNVEDSEWNGKRQIRGGWVNADAPEPAARGGLKPIEKNVVDGLRARFGGKARAIAGSVPAGGAPQPPTPAAVALDTAMEQATTPAAPVVGQEGAAGAPAETTPAAPAAPAAPTPPVVTQGTVETPPTEPTAGEIATPF